MHHEHEVERKAEPGEVSPLWARARREPHRPRLPARPREGRPALRLPAYRGTIPPPKRPLVRPRPAHRGHRAAARRRPGRRVRPRPHRASTAASRMGQRIGPPRARPRQRRAADPRTRWSRSGRPTRRAATGTPGTTSRRRWTRNFDGRRPLPDRRRGPLPLHHDQARLLSRGATTSTPGARPTSTSRSSAARSPSGWSRRCTSPATRCSTTTRSSTRSAIRPRGSA